MVLYYLNINPQKNGDHEIYSSVCQYVPNFINRKYFGVFTNYKLAIVQAKKTYPHPMDVKSIQKIVIRAKCMIVAVFAPR